MQMGWHFKRKNKVDMKATLLFILFQIILLGLIVSTGSTDQIIIEYYCDNKAAPIIKYELALQEGLQDPYSIVSKTIADLQIGMNYEIYSEFSLFHPDTLLLGNNSEDVYVYYISEILWDSLSFNSTDILFYNFNLSLQQLQSYNNITLLSENRSILMEDNFDLTYYFPGFYLRSAEGKSIIMKFNPSIENIKLIDQELYGFNHWWMKISHYFHKDVILEIASIESIAEEIALLESLMYPAWSEHLRNPGSFYYTGPLPLLLYRLESIRRDFARKQFDIFAQYLPLLIFFSYTIMTLINHEILNNKKTYEIKFRTGVTHKKMIFDDILKHLIFPLLINLVVLLISFILKLQYYQIQMWLAYYATWFSIFILGVFWLIMRNNNKFLYDLLRETNPNASISFISRVNLGLLLSICVASISIPVMIANLNHNRGQDFEFLTKPSELSQLLSLIFILLLCVFYLLPFYRITKLNINNKMAYNKISRNKILVVILVLFVFYSSGFVNNRYYDKSINYTSSYDYIIQYNQVNQNLLDIETETLATKFNLQMILVVYFYHLEIEYENEIREFYIALINDSEINPEFFAEDLSSLENGFIVKNEILKYFEKNGFPELNINGKQFELNSNDLYTSNNHRSKFYHADIIASFSSWEKAGLSLPFIDSRTNTPNFSTLYHAIIANDVPSEIEIEYSSFIANLAQVNADTFRFYNNREYIYNLSVFRPIFNESSFIFFNILITLLLVILIYFILVMDKGMIYEYRIMLRKYNLESFIKSIQVRNMKLIIGFNVIAFIQALILYLFSFSRGFNLDFLDLASSNISVDIMSSFLIFLAQNIIIVGFYAFFSRKMRSI